MALHLPLGMKAGKVPVTMSKVVRMMQGEKDLGVVAVLLRLVRRLVEVSTWFCPARM